MGIDPPLPKRFDADGEPIYEVESILAHRQVPTKTKSGMGRSCRASGSNLPVFKSGMGHSCADQITLNKENGMGHSHADLGITSKR